MTHTIPLTRPGLYFAALYAETLMYGMYCVLFVVCLLKLARDNSTPPRRSLKLMLLCLTVVMFCVATVHSAIFLQQSLSVPTTTERDPRTHARYEYTKLSLEVVNSSQCFLGDVIIISIALTLQRIKARGPAGIGLAVSPHNSYRRRQRKAENVTVVGGSLKEFFVTLICSGALYCCTFIVLLVLLLINSNVRYIVNHMIPQLAGIYPTATIVIVAFSTNDPAIQLSPVHTLLKQPSRRFDDLPPASPVQFTRALPRTNSREDQQPVSPLSHVSAASSVTTDCTMRRVFGWCRSKMHRPPPGPPRRGSESSVKTLQNSIHVHVHVERKVDEPHTPRRIASPSLPPINTNLGMDEFYLEAYVADPSKRRSIKFAGLEDDGIPPIARYRWFDDDGEHTKNDQDEGSKPVFLQWQADTSSATMATSAQEYDYENGEKTV
ncbi:hypothetical protein PENSPDRAFT_737635 [Peniophora sp. CONT]|nr:hypothetical protein PENSPDRAFT_737635 [Peniophora sp. CONT]